MGFSTPINRQNLSYINIKLEGELENVILLKRFCSDGNIIKNSGIIAKSIKNSIKNLDKSY